MADMEPVKGDAASEVGSSSQTTAPAEPIKRLKRPVKPDKEEHQAAVEQLQNELNKRRTRSEGLKQQIEQKRSAASPEVQELKNKQNALAASFRSEVDKKNAVRDQMKSLNNSRDELRASIRDQRAKLGPYVTVRKIDERVHALEHRTNHTTMEWKDEQKAREEIKKTAALKPLALVFEENQEKLKASEKERETFLEQIKVLDQKVDAIKQQREKLENEMSEQRKRDAAKVQDVPAMIKERDECREVMNALWEKIQQLRADFKVKNNEFWAESQAFREQQNQERAERRAQQEKEHHERQAERKAAAAEFAGEPYHKEVGLCDQLLSHLGKYTQQAQAQASDSSAAPAAKDSSTAFEGMKAVTKGSKVDDEFGAFMGNAPKKGKGKKGKQASGGQVQTGQKLNHSLDMIDAFHKLKVSVPTTTDKVPGALEEVQASKAYWMKKRQEVKETGVMPEEATSSVPNGVAKAPKAAKTVAPTSFNFSDQEFPGIPGQISPAKDKLAESEETTSTTEAEEAETSGTEHVEPATSSKKEAKEAASEKAEHTTTVQAAKVEFAEEPSKVASSTEKEITGVGKADQPEGPQKLSAEDEKPLKFGLEVGDNSVKVNFT